MPVKKVIFVKTDYYLSKFFLPLWTDRVRNTRNSEGIPFSLADREDHDVCDFVNELALNNFYCGNSVLLLSWSW